MIEAGAVRRLFGDAASSMLMSSTKSATGHLLGAAGAIEAIYSALAAYHDAVPPTLNLEDPADEWRVLILSREARDHKVRNVMSNSFGFGGTNASLVLGKVD